MKQILLISEDKVKTVSNLDNNVFGKWLLPAIREAQDIGLQHIIGSCLYNHILNLVDTGEITLPDNELYKDLLDNQICDYLVYQSLVNVIPLINVNMANMGTVVSNDEHIQTLSQGNIDLVRGYYQSLADVYQKRLQDYLKCNCESFPELNECGCGSCAVKPNLTSNANTSGIWLGGLRNPNRKTAKDGCCCSSKSSSKADCQEEYERGYRMGIAYQKSLLSSTAITENGTYTNDNGWNEIDIDVPDNYDEGYDDGEEHQKSLLVSTAITSNGTYTRADGYNSITVDVPQTGTTINNQVKSSDITVNGSYIVTYDSGYTGLERVDVSVNVPDRYQEGYDDKQAELSQLDVTENGTYHLGRGWSAVTVNVAQTGYTQQDLDDAYQRGYRDGYNDATGYTPSGYTLVPTSFEITSGGTILWIGQDVEIYPTVYKRTIEYKLNDGDWTSITASEQGAEILVETGDVLQFRGNNASYGYAEMRASDHYLGNHFGGTAKFNIYGNLMSLINSVNFSRLTQLSSEHTFQGLFDSCTGLQSITNLVLPAIVLSNYCYDSMFYGCSSLAQAPSLPARTLAPYCYQKMFSKCTNLTSTPSLPATTLANYCYADMFEYCDRLVTAPSLPATVLANNCYYGMFNWCVSLAQAPELPARTLTPYCYQGMFFNCTSLNYIKCLATDISATDCTNGWTRNVASTGTFVTPASTNWTTGENGIPTGWTVQNNS